MAYVHGLSGRSGDSVLSLYAVSVVTGEGRAWLLIGAELVVDVSVSVGTMLPAS